MKYTLFTALMLGATAAALAPPAPATIKAPEKRQLFLIPKSPFVLHLHVLTIEDKSFEKETAA